MKKEKESKKYIVTFICTEISTGYYDVSATSKKEAIAKAKKTWGVWLGTGESRSLKRKGYKARPAKRGEGIVGTRHAKIYDKKKKKLTNEYP